MASIFGKEKNFLNWADKIYFNTLCIENFDKIALSPTVKEIEAIFWGKNSKWLTYLEKRKVFKN